MAEPQIPRWLFDNTSGLNEVFVVHTRSPRFIARLRYEEGLQEDLPGCMHIDGGWIVEPVEWFDRYDRTTFSREEMEESVNTAWKQFDRDNH